MSIYLGEQTLNSLLSLCNKSSQSNESYENKIKILKNEKMLLNDANYTNNKSLSSLNKNGNYEDHHDSDTDSVQHNAFFVNATDSVHDNDNDSVQDHVSSDNDNASDASSDTDADATEKLNAFFVDGNYNTNIIIMPSAGALNGKFYSNLIVRISSMRNIATNNLLQKNITMNDMSLFWTFNINSDAVNVTETVQH